MRAEVEPSPGGHSAPARFFFSIRYRDRLLPDQEGVELPANTNLDACARYLADRFCADSALPAQDLEACSVEVTDSGGTLLVAVPVSDA